MIKLTDDIVVLEFRQDELDRIERPDNLPEGASVWPLIIPEEYSDWHIRWILQDFQSERRIIVLTKHLVIIYQSVTFDEDIQKYVITESLWS